MKSKWLSEDHSREWLDFNMKKKPITNEELAGSLGVDTSTIARHRGESSAKKFKKPINENFLKACTKVFGKEPELAESPLLLNLDYLHDLQERPFDNTDDAATIARFSDKFKELQIYECNFLLKHFDVFYYLDRRDWVFLSMWSVLNDKGRNLIKEDTSKMNQSVVGNELSLSQMQIYSNMKLNMRRMKYDFTEEEKDYQNTSTTKSIEKLKRYKSIDSENEKKPQVKKDRLTKNILLERMLLKFTSSKDAPPNVKRFEMDNFCEYMEAYVTMEDSDWDWLNLLTSISMGDRNRLQDLIYNLTAKEEYLTDEAITLLKEEPDFLN